MKLQKVDTHLSAVMCSKLKHTILVPVCPRKHWLTWGILPAHCPLSTWTQREVASAHITFSTSIRPCGRIKWFSLLFTRLTLCHELHQRLSETAFFHLNKYEFAHMHADSSQRRRALHIKQMSRALAHACSNTTGNTYTDLTSYIQKHTFAHHCRWEKCHHLISNLVNYFVLLQAPLKW